MFGPSSFFFFSCKNTHVIVSLPRDLISMPGVLSPPVPPKPHCLPLLHTVRSPLLNTRTHPGWCFKFHFIHAEGTCILLNAWQEKAHCCSSLLRPHMVTFPSISRRNNLMSMVCLPPDLAFTYVSVVTENLIVLF